MAEKYQANVCAEGANGRDRLVVETVSYTGWQIVTEITGQARSEAQTKERCEAVSGWLGFSEEAAPGGAVVWLDQTSSGRYDGPWG